MPDNGGYLLRQHRAPTPIEHGTYAGLQLHIKRGIPTCGACREAGREYMRRYRAAGLADRHKRIAAIRKSAMERLRERHPEEFAALYAELREQAGLNDR